MRIKKRIMEYARQNFNEVLHTTLNPEGPGVVRIHLVPPLVTDEEVGASIAIINGQDVIPVNTSWAILLSEFIKQVNEYSGREISDEETQNIIDNTCKGVRKVFPLLSKRIIKDDIYSIMHTFTQVAYGEETDIPIDYMNIGEYAEFMRAPHRMDLLVSSMMKSGCWNCNQKCIHCYAAGQENAQEDELSTEQWKQIIDKCRAAGIPQLTFTGGEPTMREDLVELIDYSRWFVTRLNTNGILLSKELCKKLAEASLDSMQITFYSYDENIHNELVGAKQYANTLAGIDNALEAGINISINTPLCSINKDYVKTLEFLHERGILYVTCSGLITTGNATDETSVNTQLSETEMRSILAEAIKYCYANGMEINFTSPGWVEHDFFEEYGIMEPNCGACLSNMAVTPSGNVVPCQSYLTDAVMGNMLQEDWDTIWNSPLCAERREYSAKMLGECPLRRKNNEN